MDREEGIQAVIDLQAFAGITESREQAEAGWDAMSEGQQEQTMMAHTVVCGESIQTAGARHIQEVKDNISHDDGFGPADTDHHGYE